MKRRIVAALAASGLAASFVGFGLSASINLNEVLEQYPGSVPVARERIDLDSIDDGTINRQGNYYTEDELIVVKRWYVARLHIAPASDMNPDPVSNCIWLTQSKLAVWITHTVSVLLCSAPHGTRVVVNEIVDLWP